MARDIARAGRSKGHVNWKMEGPLHLMMLPAVVLLAIFNYYPLYGNVIRISIRDWAFSILPSWG